LPDPRALAYGWRDALVGRDAEAFAALFAPDALFVDVDHCTGDLGAVRPLRGREEIRAMCVAWLAATPSFEYEVEQVPRSCPSAPAGRRVVRSGACYGLRMNLVATPEALAFIGERGGKLYVWLQKLG
jgi:hypothetical protein